MIEIDFWKAKKCNSFILVINICILIDTSQCLVEGRVRRCFWTFLSYWRFERPLKIYLEAETCAILYRWVECYISILIENNMV